MSNILDEYRRHREQGHLHHDAVKAIARRFDLDRQTAARRIALAEVTERLNRKTMK